MIVVGGENLIDFLQVSGDDTAPIYQANVGGGPYNCAKALGRQQSNVGYITPISRDTLGALLAKSLQDSGVKLLAARGSKPTSLAVVSLENGLPSYQFYRENTAERNVTTETLTRNSPELMRALYIGSLALTGGPDADAWAAYFCARHNSGVFTFLDPNIRADFIHDRGAYLKRLDKVLAHTDLLKLSDEDLEWLIPGTQIEDAARQFSARTSAKITVVTLGADGAFALIDNRKVSVPAAIVNGLRDTVGAGDTFMATLISRLDKLGCLQAEALASMDDAAIENLLHWAGCAAAMNCEKDGCNPPDLAALQTRMRLG